MHFKIPLPIVFRLRRSLTDQQRERSARCFFDKVLHKSGGRFLPSCVATFFACFESAAVAADISPSKALWNIELEEILLMTNSGAILTTTLSAPPSAGAVPL